MTASGSCSVAPAAQGLSLSVRRTRLNQIQTPGSATGVTPRLQEEQAWRPPRLNLIQAQGSMRVLGV